MNYNYYNTFIKVSSDCPVASASVPVARGGSKTVPVIEYELLSGSPYGYTQEEVLFEVYLRHKGIPAAEVKARRAELRAEFFGKPHACLRASALPKRYGWGIHFDPEGKVALVPMESEAYRRFLASEDAGVTVLAAMRSRRA